MLLVKSRHRWLAHTDQSPEARSVGRQLKRCQGPGTRLFSVLLTSSSVILGTGYCSGILLIFPNCCCAAYTSIRFRRVLSTKIRIPSTLSGRAWSSLHSSLRSYRHPSRKQLMRALLVFCLQVCYLLPVCGEIVAARHMASLPCLLVKDVAALLCYVGRRIHLDVSDDGFFITCHSGMEPTHGAGRQRSRYPGSRLCGPQDRRPYTLLRFRRTSFPR